MKDERGVALFIDHYNIHNGCDKIGILRYNYDVLAEVASEAGRMVLGRVYLVTDRHSSGVLHKFFGLGIDPAYAPEYPNRDGGKPKSLADPMMICDIMQTLYERPFIETFVIVSGDKDFIPVIRKISEHGKQAIVIGVEGIGVEGSTAPALITECARLNFKFLAYETIHRDPKSSRHHE